MNYYKHLSDLIAARDYLRSRFYGHRVRVFADEKLLREERETRITGMAIVPFEPNARRTWATLMFTGHTHDSAFLAMLNMEEYNQAPERLELDAVYVLDYKSKGGLDYFVRRDEFEFLKLEADEITAQNQITP